MALLVAQVHILNLERKNVIFPGPQRDVILISSLKFLSIFVCENSGTVSLQILFVS